MLTEIQVGVITTTHGLKGEVKVFPTTDDPHRFDDLKEVTAVTEKGMRKALHIDGVKYFKGRPIVKFHELPNIEEAQLLRGALLMIPRSEAMPLAEGEYFVGDLIGCAVKDEDGQMLGEIKDVLKTGANDVYYCQDLDGKDLLIPVIEDCVLAKHPEEGYVVVRLMPWV